eukprot:CAMPEP_0115832024 /NCGR_PEP_ID=MMETSP0287-20121206/2442_1 /TAXON_ID=412157 /ORGANISM="Chrysochromulina rotalis, Strain UIO044" /LENGTH=73 /DNA_ID=CAMNT_0003285391 /DNA_START=504 /DNA_END=722 /DNA_ORIENTATION=+
MRRICRFIPSSMVTSNHELFSAVFCAIFSLRTCCADGIGSDACVVCQSSSLTSHGRVVRPRMSIPPFAMRSIA